jgi:DHA2 family multidrug resistance protein-like MFS transporter
MGTFAAYTGLMIVMISLPFGLQQRFHFTPAAAGSVLAALPLMSTIVAPVAGLLSDRYSAAALGGIGMIIGFAGMLCLAFLPPFPLRLDLVWRIAICGVGYGMFFSPNARQIIGSAPLGRTAAAGALFSTLRGAGQTLGATAVSALLAAGIGLGSPPAFIAAGLALIAGICSLTVFRIRVRVPEPVDMPDP